VLIEIPKDIGMQAANGLMVLSFDVRGCDAGHTRL